MKFLRLGIALILLASSCNQPRYVYSQSTRNLHFFTGKGEAKLSGALATGPSRNLGNGVRSYNKGYDLQGAYAVADVLALTGGYYSRKEKDLMHVSSASTAVSEVNYKRHGWEFGASLFGPLANSKESFLHVDAGFGGGAERFTDRGTFDSLTLTRSFSNKALRLYFQPGIYTGGPELRFALGVRMQWTWFREIRTDYTDAELDAYSLRYLDFLNTVEPYVCFRLNPQGAPWLGVELQGSFNVPRESRYVRSAYVSLGLNFSSAGLKRRPRY